MVEELPTVLGSANIPMTDAQDQIVPTEKYTSMEALFNKSSKLLNALSAAKGKC